MDYDDKMTIAFIIVLILVGWLLKMWLWSS